MNIGSGDSLKLSTRWGLSPNARQIRDTVDCDIPVAAASERVDQCVASRGVCSRVLTITRSTSSSLIVRGPPGRGSSCSPLRRPSTKRARHLPTVLRSTPRSTPTSLLDRPSAQASTIRHRRARACELVWRRAQRPSVSRSSPLRTSSAIGVPRIAASHRRASRQQERGPQHENS